MAKGATKEKEELQPITDEQFARFMADIRPNEQDSLRRVTLAEVASLGFASTREGSRTWEKAQRQAVTKLLNSEMRLGDIEWAEE